MTLAEFEIALEQDIFDSLLKQHGAYKLARLLSNQQSYRAYDQRFPRDKWAQKISLDWMMESGFVIPADGEGLDEESMNQEMAAEFKASLTPRQRQILVFIQEGYSQPEIAQLMGYPNTAIVRYQKYLIKKKWGEFND